MASTGAYRQILQQIFAIPIEEENTDGVPQTINNMANNEDDSISTFDEFEEDTKNVNEQTISKNVIDYTEEDIETEFADF